MSEPIQTVPQLTTMSKHYRIFVPIDAATMEYCSTTISKKLQKRLVNEFKGYTKTKAKGGWKNPDGDLIEEKVFIFDIYTNNSNDEFINANCKWLLRNTNESQILLLNDGEITRFE